MLKHFIPNCIFIDSVLSYFRKIRSFGRLKCIILRKWFIRRHYFILPAPGFLILSRGTGRRSTARSSTRTGPHRARTPTSNGWWPKQNRQWPRTWWEDRLCAVGHPIRRELGDIFFKLFSNTIFSFRIDLWMQPNLVTLEKTIQNLSLSKM